MLGPDIQPTAHHPFELDRGFSPIFDDFMQLDEKLDADG